MMNEKAAAAEVEFLSVAISHAFGEQKRWLRELLERFKSFAAAETEGTGPR
jgi:hypothetical protein